MENELHKGANPKLFDYAKQNRKNSTNAENILWERIRNRKLKGYKFRRQHPVDSFIADFYCHECLLIVEVDGEVHDETEQSEYDVGRTYELNEHGLKLIRFSNEEIMKNIDDVLRKIELLLIPKWNL